MRALLIGLLILGCLGIAAMADAQMVGCNQNKKWNLTATLIEWEYTAVVDPPPVGIRIKIGTTPGQYTITRDFPPTQFSATLNSLVPGPGAYYAVAVPLEGPSKQEGGESAQCFFELGLNRLGLGLKSQ